MILEINVDNNLESILENKLENKLEKTKALTADKMRELEHMKKQVDVLTSESLRKDGDLDYAQKDVVSKIA